MEWSLRSAQGHAVTLRAYKRPGGYRAAARCAIGLGKTRWGPAANTKTEAIHRFLDEFQTFFARSSVNSTRIRLRRASDAASRASGVSATAACPAAEIAQGGNPKGRRQTREQTKRRQPKREKTDQKGRGRRSTAHSEDGTAAACPAADASVARPRAPVASRLPHGPSATAACPARAVLAACPETAPGAERPPLHVHQVFGLFAAEGAPPPPMPSLFKKSHDAWRKLCQRNGYEYKLWGKGEADELIKNHYPSH